MKNVIYIVLAALVFVSCEKKVKSDKIGFVDNSLVFKEYQEKIDLEAKFELKEQAFRNKFDSIDLAFQREVQIFQANANKMSKNMAQQKYQNLGEKKQMQDQQKQVEAQQFQTEYQTELDSLITKVKKFEKDYGKTNGYTFIFGTTDAMSSVLYAEEGKDLTKIMLESLNANYKNK